MNQILVVVHQEHSSPGLVGEKLEARGYHLDMRCPALGDTLPSSMAGYVAAIVFGGPMSANDDDTLPFIRTELNWIPTVLAAQTPYLGICLGAQLLARVLGGKISPHPQEQSEIGYFSLRPNDAENRYFPYPMMVYQWHREGFTIPEGAVSLATGDTFPNQAFRYGETAIGLQFHPEITQTLIDLWTIRAADQLILPGAQPRDVHFVNHERFGSIVDRWLDNFLDQWLAAGTWSQRQSA